MARGSNRNVSGDVVLESRHLMGLFVLMVVIFGVVFVLGYELGRNQTGNKVKAADVQPGDADSPRPLPNADTLDTNVPNKKSASGDGFNKPAPSNQPPASIAKPDKEVVNPGKTKTPPATVTPPRTTPAPVVTTPSKAQPASKTATPAISATGKKTPPASAPAPNKTAIPPSGNSGGTKTQPGNVPADNKSQGASLNAPLIPRGAYLIQVAALTKETDALEMAEALQQRKFPAFVVPTGADKFYHVQVGPYADQKSAETARRALESAGFKTLIKH